MSLETRTDVYRVCGSTSADSEVFFLSSLIVSPSKLDKKAIFLIYSDRVAVNGSASQVFKIPSMKYFPPLQKHANDLNQGTRPKQ